MFTQKQKCIYAFGQNAQGKNVTEGNATMRDVLGGKGANLAEMTNIGLPVPAGFTISCDVCLEFLRNNCSMRDGFYDEVAGYIHDLEKRTNKGFGDPKNPLLVSVRSGAPVSMPGMMDTVLNLGLNDQSVNGLINQTKSPRFAWDSYRRFIQMFSNVVMGIPSDLFENALIRLKRDHGVQNDTELTEEDLYQLTCTFKDIFACNIPDDMLQEFTGQDIYFPQDPYVQLRLAIEAVFKSWNNKRAILYREKNHLSHEMGTAVNVQAMVFGNRGDASATGVAFTRNPATGEKEFYGDYLINAQGEDVVAGIRNTQPIATLKDNPGLEEAGHELEYTFVLLENHFHDMCDIEFTIEEGKLWMLQTRVGKRTAQAAVKCAIDMEKEGLIDEKEALLRVSPDNLDQLLHPQFKKDTQKDVVAHGLNASPGAAVGEVVFSSETAVAFAEAGRDCILLRWETNPDDLNGMLAAQGILTSHGGKTSHAAVIARGMGKPCVCGVEALQIDADNKQARIQGSDIVLHEGDLISLDGTTGDVVLGKMELIRPEITDDVHELLCWAEKYAKIGVQANADTPKDARVAHQLGAQGIGLCRTEHMFLGQRKQIIQNFILDTNEENRKNYAQRLCEVQTQDFYEMLSEMDGQEVTIRLLDPPLHEFLDNPRDLAVEIAEKTANGTSTSELQTLQAQLKRIDELSEQNPMMGMRGCRLAVMYPILPKMQVKAITTAAIRLVNEGKDPRPKIMIPLVAFENELVFLRNLVKETIQKTACELHLDFDIPVGTMIELPRAALRADKLAQHADFFSFGTNDLTQTTLGFSRDDVEAEFISQYMYEKIIPDNPFAHIDDAVVELVDVATNKGKRANAHLSCGVCGEHGGDPYSIDKLAQTNIDYVSCSPYRVPVARLACAQAAIKRM